MNKNPQKSVTTKNRRKFISPVFHVKSHTEDEKHLSNEIIKDVKRTGILNLHGKHLSIVPNGIFNMYSSQSSTELTFNFNNTNSDEDLWWNFKPLIKLDLSSNVLTEIPEELCTFKDLTTLNLQDNSLTTLPIKITELTKLNKLFINRNKINKLPDDVDKFIDLRIFNTSFNRLEEVPNSLVDLVMLEKLNLSDNALKILPSGIGFLVHLTDFDISNNKLTDLPPDIVNLRSLLKLNLNKNSIKHLPGAFGELRKLEILYAQHNDIEEIPEFADSNAVQEIYLGNNFIKEIPLEFFENMQNLKILELRDNQISNLPKEIIKLVQISKFDLSNNQLTEVPSSLALLPHLSFLKIDGNKLKHIRNDIIRRGTQQILQFLRQKLNPDDIDGFSNDFFTNAVSVDSCIFPDRHKMRNGRIMSITMKNLQEIPEKVFDEAKDAKVSIVDLCKNKFTHFPKGLLILSDYLTEINLSNNQIKDIPNEISQCSKLKFLDLSANFLNSLPETMSVMVNLREIALFNNRFNKIPECIFGMVGLEILMLNDNNIQEINIEGLKKLNRLATLNLSNNSIGFVPHELGLLTQLRNLELKGNSFRQPRYALLEEGTEILLAYLRDRIPT